MKPVPVRWILAFDADCGTCKAMSDRIKTAAGGKLEVIPLSNPDVERWRGDKLGSDAPHVPCLIRLRGEDVQVWTGFAMATRLSTRLGVSGTARLLKMLGEMRRDASRRCGSSEEGALGRGQFLRLMGAGVAVAVAAVAGQAVPALAASRPLSEAQKWVRANKGSLPESYADLIGFDIEYRRAIFGSLEPDACRRLWVEHFNAYRDSHKAMTSAQRSIVERAIELVREARTLYDRSNAMSEGSPVYRALQDLRLAAFDAFGKDEARRLLATLGPEDQLKAVDCECIWADDYCTGGKTCVSCGCAGINNCDRCNSGNCWCNCSPYGCGTVWAYTCSGTCQ